MAETAVEYRPIPGFDGYCVGSDGSVWTSLVCRGSPTGGRKKAVPGDKWRRRKPFVNRGRWNYRYVTLTQISTGKTFSLALHSIVLTAFVGPKPDGMECRHLDGDKANNSRGNLAWGTAVENAQDKERHGVVLRGESHPRRKLTAEQVLEIRRAHAAKECNQKTLAARFGVAEITVSFIVRRVTWAHL